MAKKFLYEELDAFSRFGGLKREIPELVKTNLNPAFEIRSYQIEAFARFIHCMNEDFPEKEWPLHFLFNMATGSGKTLIMAGLILYLFNKGYHNFLFFVNSTNTIEKTKDNFLNPQSSKYLFNKQIVFGSNRVTISNIPNFAGNNPDQVNIYFTTIQKLHLDLTITKENSLTYEGFRAQKLVLIADEAHHMNTKTRADIELFESWENTVEQLFFQRKDNLLLEFTATLDYAHKNIVRKYLNKVLYRYDLKDFRNDGYSKDVYIVQSDFDERDRILQALILSQYKQEVAAKHQINLKPVMLFKAQRTIVQSKQNKDNFHRLIENLSVEHIERIRNKSDNHLLKRAFYFFDENHISSEQLVLRLKLEFDINQCLSVNEEREKEAQQLLLNSLENSDNSIRAIFAVQKLNEGWDVLNLFDIVRCYETRDSKAGKPGKTTTSEAQLIGRGARYYPFVTNSQMDRFRRKFDKDLNNELRILEELHYHSINDSRYISELRKALVQEGIWDDREIERELKLKETFKKTDFYTNGIIYINERIKNTYEHVYSFNDFGVKKRNYTYSIATGHSVTNPLLDDNYNTRTINEICRIDVKVKDIYPHIKKNALARLPFYNFRDLKHYFPYIESINDFIESEAYLGGLVITFQGEASNLKNLSNKTMLDALIGLLQEVESEIHKNITEYKGTIEFRPNKVSQVFNNKVLKLNKANEKSNGDKEFVYHKDWYVFNANYGTQEEKAFVRMLDRQMDSLRKKYDGIYLIRNERHFKIYAFSDGKGFEPDFVLYLIEKNGKLRTYQLYIEPKGKYLKEHDIWKQELLEEITSKFKDEVIKFTEKENYRLIGVPFYNNEDENEFIENLNGALNNYTTPN